ncbi:MAG: hypothetical protein EBV40_07910 [Actinobacteria bacterium]|nr:hypothetical protein [Actinomycetota bacterium]
MRDVLVAINAIEQHLQRGALSDPLIFDAVRVRLIEIGEAVSHVDQRLLRQEPLGALVSAVNRLLGGKSIK